LLIVSRERLRDSIEWDGRVPGFKSEANKPKSARDDLTKETCANSELGRFQTTYTKSLSRTNDLRSGIGGKPLRLKGLDLESAVLSRIETTYAKSLGRHDLWKEKEGVAPHFRSPTDLSRKLHEG